MLRELKYNIKINMNNTRIDKFIYFVIIAMIIIMVIWMLLKSHREIYREQPNYYVYYIASNPIPKLEPKKIPNENEIEMRNYENKKKISNNIINTESIIFGSHNSSHNSPIIASPYNPPNMKRHQIGGYYGLIL